MYEKKDQVKKLGEFGLIDLIKNNLLIDPRNVVAGIGDDAAVLRQPTGELLLATTDMMIEEVHFKIDRNNGSKVGFRVMAANVSDIAAMGGKPTHALVSIGVRWDTPVSYIEDIYKGMRKCSIKYGINIVGGDTVFSPNNLVINIMLLGTVKKDKYLLRSKACPGDSIIVTGYLGDSSAGIDMLLNKYEIPKDFHSYLVDRHYYPTPRIWEVAAAQGAGKVTAANDISDGLGSELHEIASASGVGALIWFDSLPISEEVREVSKVSGKDTDWYALFGGEDFEVVMTVKPEDTEAVVSAVEKETGTKASVVGVIKEKSQGVQIIKEGLTIDLDKKGYDHFSKQI
ncbi:MAG: thiamine-phosphate kinase [Clostridia bacterium]|nr:thiamine-phosphate kinase [Clostridia bacterium]